MRHKLVAGKPFAWGNSNEQKESSFEVCCYGSTQNSLEELKAAVFP